MQPMVRPQVADELAVATEVLLGAGNVPLQSEAQRQLSHGLSAGRAGTGVLAHPSDSSSTPSVSASVRGRNGSTARARSLSSSDACSRVTASAGYPRHRPAYSGPDATTSTGSTATVSRAHSTS